MLTDNLKKYIEIGFNIDTRGFDNMNGSFENDADRDAFYSECAAVFSAAGWECGKDYCVYVNKGKSSLHIHPQQLLGIVSEDLIEEVRYVIGTAKTFELRWKWSGGLFDRDHERAKVPMIHRMGTKYDITPEQQTEYLVEKRTEIETCLLERYRTKRRNQFYVAYSQWGTMLDIGERVGVSAIDECAKNAAGKFVGEVFNELVDTGKIIRAEINGQASYRSRMKSEKIA